VEVDQGETGMSETTTKLRCECGELVVVVDDNGSIACPADCGWEGIHLELVAVIVPEDQIQWVGE